MNNLVDVNTVDSTVQSQTTGIDQTQLQTTGTDTIPQSQLQAPEPTTPPTELEIDGVGKVKVS